MGKENHTDTILFSKEKREEIDKKIQDFEKRQKDGTAKSIKFQDLIK